MWSGSAEADECDVAILVGSCVQLTPKLIEIERCERMTEGDDLDELPAERSIEVGVSPRPLHADMLAGEIDGLVVLDVQVVVVVGQLRVRC